MNAPKETLYVNNLSDKMKKEPLKRRLYWLFSQYGAIVDIVAQKTPRTRGQAFIIFRDVPTASAALKGLQGFNFYNRKLSINFAKEQSDAIAKLEGTYRRKSAKARAKERQEKDKAFLLRQKGDKSLTLSVIETEDEEEEVVAESRGVILAPKRARDQGAEGEKEGKRAKVSASGDDDGVPNNILVLSDVPKTETGKLKIIFSPFPGFVEIRIAPSEEKTTHAFVEYTTTNQASDALLGLKGFPISSNYTVNLKYAKKADI